MQKQMKNPTYTSFSQTNVKKQDIIMSPYLPAIHKHSKSCSLIQHLESKVTLDWLIHPFLPIKTFVTSKFIYLLTHIPDFNDPEKESF